MRIGSAALLLVLLIPAALSAQEPRPKFAFQEIGHEAGLFPHLNSFRGHGAAWGDIDSDGWPDLFVAAFHNLGSVPGALFRNQAGGRFSLDPQPHLRTSGIGSGALFADLDNVGRLDLYVSNCAGPIPSFLFRNDGQGKFTDISANSGACPAGFQGRGLAALDYDGDGLLDLILCEQYYDPKVKTGPLLLRNKGKHRFENVSAAAGLPPGFGGLGVAVGDFNEDRWPDLFFTSGAGENRLYLNDGQGKFREATNTRDVFRWTNVTKNDSTAGVCVGDVNADGRLDIVIGHHFKQPWVTPVPIRLYLNRGTTTGETTFTDVTESCGLAPLYLKPPHVEIQDFDNDGLPDIYLGVYKFDAKGRPHPVIYKNLGSKGGMPRFVDTSTGVNDFPSDELRAIHNTRAFFERITKDKIAVYSAAAPTCDFDRDGKLDIFMANFLLQSPSLLLRNETSSGNWLDIAVEGNDGVNRMGIGARVNVYPAGQLSQPAARLGSQEIAIGYGYCSGQEAMAHFGLPQTTQVDIEVLLPHGRGVRTQKGVAANQRIVVKQ